MNDLKVIEKQCEQFADARHALSDVVANMEDELRAIKRKYMSAIRKQLPIAQRHQDKLNTLIEQNPDLFEKPRTHTLHGIKVGYQKGRGEVCFDNKDKVVTRIKKKYPDEWSHLIKTTETPIKAALGKLMARDLKPLGITILETEDSVIIKPADSEIDKLVDAMLKDDDLNLKQVA